MIVRIDELLTAAKASVAAKQKQAAEAYESFMTELANSTGLPIEDGIAQKGSPAQKAKSNTLQKL